MVGWLALASSLGSLVAYRVSAQLIFLGVAATAALVAAVSSAFMPEPRPRAANVRFAPLEEHRAARRRPSLARQLLTLP